MKNLMNRFQIIIAISILFSTVCITRAGNSLTIPAVEQFKSNLCWDAACYMVLVYYYPFKTFWQTDIMTYGTQGENRGNTFTYAPTGDHACNEVLINFGPVSSQVVGGNLTFTQLKTEIDGGRPIMVGWKIPGDANIIGHAVLIKGYTSSNVVYNDPADGGEHSDLTYADFVDNNVHTWDESLVMTSLPPWITGVNDYVKITSGPSGFTYPGSSSTYTCAFTGVPPCNASSFNWSIGFEYAGGTYTVANATRLGSNYSTWLVQSFTLPAGYPWLRKDNGLVMGKVLVTTTDSDNIPHSDFLMLTYAEQNPYPNYIYFENQTVSSSQPDVTAHNGVSLTNDVITSGGSVSIKGGNSITINDGVNIQNGSTVNFIVDPNLQ